MAWIYFPELVGSQALLASGSEQSPIVNLTGMLRASYCPECDQVILTELLSGTMCELSKQRCSQESTSSPRDFPAKTSALRGLVTAWMVSAADFSLRSSDYVAIFDPDSFSWKTSQLSLFGGLTGFVWSSLRSGMIRDGRLFQPENLAPATFENDGGFLPTPTASDYGKNVGRKSDGITPSGKDRWSLTVRARRGELPGHPKGYLNPMWVERVMGYPFEWTAIDPLVTQWFQSKPKRPSKDCVA